MVTPVFFSSTLSDVVYTPGKSSDALMQQDGPSSRRRMRFIKSASKIDE
jgi:hypothetical protein